jgi:hypothetical protein
MYTRISESGGRRYLQLVEGHRDELGKVRIKVVANLGRLDKLGPGQLDPLINGLNRAVGRLENTASDIAYDSSLAYGDVFALHELWKDLGFDRALSRALRSGRREIDAEASPLSLGPMALQWQLRAMVFNRLCDPTSKLGCLRWLETVAMPAMPEGVTHQHLLRAMDALMDHAEVLEIELARQIRPLVDQDLAVVFYDLTTVRIHGEGEVDDDLRAFGLNKETGGIARQFVLGVVQTAEGLPLMHTVHPGNMAETKTLQAMLASSWSRQPCAANTTPVRISEARSWVTSAWRRGSFRRATIHGTMPLRSRISRNTPAPGSPASRSTLLSIRSERLKPGVTGCSVSPMRASDAAVGFCLAA